MKSLGIIENWNRRWLLENLNSAFWPFEDYKGGVQDCERIRSIIRGAVSMASVAFGTKWVLDFTNKLPRWTLLGNLRGCHW